MHQRAAELRPFGSPGVVDGTAPCFDCRNNAASPLEDGGAQLDGSGHLTWEYKVLSVCTQVQISVASALGGHQVELRLGGVDGRVIATGQLEATGSDQIFVTQSFVCTVPEDHKDTQVTLCFSGAEQSSCVQWLRFYTKASGEELDCLLGAEQLQHHAENSHSIGRQHLQQVEGAGCTEEDPGAAMARREAGDAKKQAKTAKQAWQQATETAALLKPMLQLKMKDFASRWLNLQLRQLEYGYLMYQTHALQAALEQRRLEFAQRVQEEEAARQLYLQAIMSRREAGQQIPVLQEVVDQQEGEMEASVWYKLQRMSHALAVLTEDRHDTAARQTNQAADLRVEAERLAKAAAQCALKKCRLETEDKTKKAAAMAADKMRIESEQALLAHQELSDDDDEYYTNVKPAMMLFHKGHPVSTVINVTSADEVRDHFHPIIQDKDAKWRKFDKDGDGELDEDELKKIEQAFDKNGDGKLNGAEQKALDKTLGR